MKIFKLLGSLCLAVPAVLLLAIGPRGQVDVPKGVVVVEYWEKWTGEEGAAIRRTVDDFNNTVGREKGIHVNLLTTSGVVQKTLISTAGGVPPDVAGLWETGIAQFAALDALESLDDLAAQHGIKREAYKPIFWDECLYDGKLYALVSTPYNYLLHYNTKIFAEKADTLRAAGLDPTRPPRTIAELDRYATALNEVGPDGQIIKSGFIPMEPGWDQGFLAVYWGSDWWDKKNNRFQFTDPKVVEAYSWMQGYSKRLGKAAVADFHAAAGSYDSPQNPFMLGTVAMVDQGTFMANTIHNQRPSMDKDWAVGPFPTETEELFGANYCTADVLVIPKGAKHKKEAFEFIAYTQRQDVMEKLCNAHCKISALKAASENFLTHHKNPFIREFERLANGPGAVGTPRVEIMPTVTEELNNFLQNLVVLNVEPEQGLKDVQDRLTAKLNDFRATQALRKQ